MKRKHIMEASNLKITPIWIIEYYSYKPRTIPFAFSISLLYSFAPFLEISFEPFILFK